MMKFNFTIITLLYVQIFIAQNLSPTVVNSSGGVIQNATHSLEWSLGELAVSTLSSPDNILTQGFLQPTSNIVKTSDYPDENYFLAFPNPVSQELTLQTNIPGVAKVWVYDVSGKLVLQTAFQQHIDLKLLDSGLYVISLLNAQNHFLHTFKISKI